MTELNGVRLPDWYNGIGLHDSPGCYVATMNYDEAKSHANDMKAHGCAGPYKLFVSGGNKVERARGYVDSGIIPIIRDWREQPWGKPPSTWVMPVDQIRLYADVGVQLFEIAGNEFNIACEWKDGNIPNNPDLIAKAAVDAFEVALNACAQIPGTYPLFSSATPGGNVNHRLCYPAIVAELTRRGLLSLVRHIAVHPRPHNNPPETRWSAENTVTWDEWRWIRDQFHNGAFYWATEHGYSLNDDQNHTYPKITLDLHTNYNWQLDLWMEDVTEPELAGYCHWFEAGWGAWGAWPKDSLRDSIVPEMPAPSPLWIRMGNQANELEFNRYDEIPVTDYAKGFDCSSYQGDINWDAVATDFSFVFIRGSAGLTPDTKYGQNYDAAGEHGLLRGAYHYLRQELDGQARLFYETCVNKPPELGWYADIEQSELTADKCALFLATLDGWTGETAGIYTRASFFNKFGSPSWTQGRKLWVAHWDVAEPTLPQAWSDWEFWQTGQGLVAGQNMDLNSYNGDEESLYDSYGPEEPPVEVDVLVFDMYGNEQDWDWIEATYGDVQIIEPDGDHFAVTQLNEVEGIMGFTCTLLNESGGPVAGQQVAYIWPDGEQIEVTNANGVADHTAGPGEGYWYPGPGPISWEVRGEQSDLIGGLGWLLGSNHRHLQITMQWNGGDDPPPPPDDWEADTTERLERIEATVDDIWVLLNHIHDTNCGPDPQ